MVPAPRKKRSSVPFDSAALSVAARSLPATEVPVQPVGASTQKSVAEASDGTASAAAQVTSAAGRMCRGEFMPQLSAAGDRFPTGLAPASAADNRTPKKPA